MTPRKTTAPVAPFATQLVGRELLVTFPQGTTLGQAARWGADHQFHLEVAGERWIVRSFSDGVARCWSPDLRSAAA